MNNLNDLIPKIIALHKKREGLKDGQMTQREANLIVCCLEQFDSFLLERDQKNKEQINIAVQPEWLDVVTAKKAALIYCNHKPGDNLHAEAARIIQECGEKAGYKITMRHALKIIIEHCL